MSSGQQKFEKHYLNQDKALRELITNWDFGFIKDDADIAKAQYILGVQEYSKSYRDRAIVHFLNSAHAGNVKAYYFAAQSMEGTLKNDIMYFCLLCGATKNDKNAIIELCYHCLTDEYFKSQIKSMYEIGYLNAFKNAIEICGKSFILSKNALCLCLKNDSKTQCNNGERIFLKDWAYDKLLEYAPDDDVAKYYLGIYYALCPYKDIECTAGKAKKERYSYLAEKYITESNSNLYTPHRQDILEYLKHRPAVLLDSFVRTFSSNRIPLIEDKG